MYNERTTSCSLRNIFVAGRRTIPKNVAVENIFSIPYAEKLEQII